MYRVAVLILNIQTKYRKETECTPRPPYCRKELRHPLKRGMGEPQEILDCSGEEKISCSYWNSNPKPWEFPDQLSENHRLKKAYPLHALSSPLCLSGLLQGL